MEYYRLTRGVRRVTNTVFSILIMIVTALASVVPVILPGLFAFICGLSMGWVKKYDQKRFYFLKLWLYWSMFMIGAAIPLLSFFWIKSGRLDLNFGSIAMLANLGAVIILYPLGVLIGKYSGYSRRRGSPSSNGQTIVLISKQK